jgi:hypothetical protein
LHTVVRRAVAGLLAHLASIAEAIASAGEPHEWDADEDGGRSGYREEAAVEI